MNNLYVSMILKENVDTSINSVDVSISEKCYMEKNTNWGSVRYKRKRVTIDELAGKLRKGYCVCHCFKTDGTTFGQKEKTNNNFLKADVVFIDIDDCNIEMNDFVGRLTKKPTLYYTTPNNVTEKSGFRYRFRLVYQFAEPITNVDDYERLYFAITSSITKDVPTFLCKDNCGKSASQQFGGNGKDNCVMKMTRNVFSFSDFPFQMDIASPPSLYYSEMEKTKGNQYTDVKFTDMEFMRDMDGMKPTDLIRKYENRYPFFESSPLTYEDGYAIIPDDYRQIYRTWYIDTFEKDNGTVIKFSRLRKIRDKEQRRRKLYFGALIRKQILPSITFEHLMFNLIYEREYFFDNSDKAITNKVLANIAKQVVSTPLEKITIKSEPRHKRKFAIDKTYCAEHSIKPNAYKNVVRKKLKDEEIGSAYDCSKTVKENLAMFKEMGIKVGKAKLYAWCKENGIPTKPKPMTQSPFLFVPTVEVDIKKQEPCSSIVASASCVNSSFVSF